MTAENETWLGRVRSIQREHNVSGMSAIRAVLAQGRMDGLAEVVYRAKAEAWDACLDAIDQNELNTDQAREGNPYRTGGKQ